MRDSSGIDLAYWLEAAEHAKEEARHRLRPPGTPEPVALPAFRTDGSEEGCQTTPAKTEGEGA